MALSKSLLLKGLAGAATVAGAVGGGGLFWFKDDIFGDNKAADLGEDDELGKFSHKELIDKVGLSCGLTGKELKESEDKECKVKDNGALNIKIDEKTEEGVTFTDPAKLRVRRSKGEETYSRGLKFVVDSGDITLSKSGGSGSPTTIPKLEQFETYEIEKEGDKFYLKRKTKADVGIKNALGLGRLTLPDNTKGETSNSYDKPENIKLIRFEGHSEGISVTAGSSITLKVAKTVDATTFPFGYIFNFTFPADININGKQLKGNIPYEFKIKKAQTGNSLTLEQAWTDNNVFTKKAGLDCTNNSTSGCTVSSESQKLNVKVGHLKREGVTTVTVGKIKMETGQAGYNQGLKFSIDGDVTLGEGGTGEITKLEELETYEIAEYGGKYYLTKKTSPDDLIKKTLSLPDKCKLPTTDAPVNCDLDEGEFKAINFEGKDANKPTGTAKLTISKANSTDFPFGYKFAFRTETDTEIKASNTTIKGKIPKDFKIKKGSGTGTGITLSLEKAWDDEKYSLAAKVGLECTDSNGSVTCCTKNAGGSPSVKLNVKKGNDKKEDITTVSTTNTAKIKVEKDQEGYNQGLKFTITGGDVSLSGGNKSADSANDIEKLEELETYEITEDKGKYYLTRKTSKEDVLKESLSIPESCFKNLGSSCSISSQDLQKIQFNEKDSPGPTGDATLTVTKADSKDFPLGYRFTFSSEKEITIKSGTTTIKAKIPTDFKIKKGAENNGTPSLTLEKAWSENKFVEKVGLDCTTDSNGCCTKANGGSEKLNVKKGNDKKHDISSIDTSSGKIKMEKDKEGYNQGLKFTITGGDVSLSGGTKADGSTDITKLDEYETYEITEEGGKYYLTRKTEASETIGDLLGLKGARCSLSGTSSTCNLSTEQIKKINFDGKDTSGVTTSGTATLTIAKVDKVDDFPLGYKFTFNTTGDVTIKAGTTSIKANIPTEFKIKKGTEGQTPALSLEKAWTAESLGKKVGLTCSNGTSSDECSKASNGNQLNIKKDSDKKEGINSISGSGKIKFEKDQDGYNHGLKLYIDGGDVTLTGGTENKKSGSGENLSILEEYETYEIKEDGGQWYLARKHESIVFLKKQLGFEFCDRSEWKRYAPNTSGGPDDITFTCSITNVEHLKKIKFSNKKEDHNWPTGKIELHLEMKRKKTANTSNYGEIELTISDNSSEASTVCIPDGNGGTIDLKSNSSGAAYKIKKGSGSDTLCLIKSGGSSTQCTTG